MTEIPPLGKKADTVEAGEKKKLMPAIDYDLLLLPRLIYIISIKPESEGKIEVGSKKGTIKY